MKFFNKKQDVLDIQLTSYGKKKLSSGDFKPYYYCFFDDNVLYDGSYGGLSEEQNAVQTRILENIQYLKINPTSKGAETKLKERNKEIFEGENDNLEMKDYYGDSIQNAADKTTICKYKLGNSKLNLQLAPMMSVNAFGSPFDEDTFLTTYSGSGIVQEIPQINVNLTHSATLYMGAPDRKDEFQQYIYPDEEDDIVLLTEEEVGTKISIQLKGDYLLLDFGEENVEYLKDNFEFEVYEIVTRENPRGNEDIMEDLIPLQLKNRTQFESTDPDESYFHNYVEILTDRDIPPLFLEALPTLSDFNNININTFDPSTFSDRTRITNDIMTDSVYTGNNQDPEDCS